MISDFFETDLVRCSLAGFRLRGFFVSSHGRGSVHAETNCRAFVSVLFIAESRLQISVKQHVNLFHPLYSRITNSFALYDDHRHISKGTEIIQRIIPNYDHIGSFPFFDAAGLGINPDDFGVPERGGMQRVAVGGADVFVIATELPPEVIVQDERAANVISQTYGDSVL